MLALVHHRVLVDAGGLVSAIVAAQVVHFTAIRTLDHHAIAGDAGNLALDRSGHHLARIQRRTILHTRAYQRGLGPDQRHALALHIRAHQRTVRIVMFQEGDERR